MTRDASLQVALSSMMPELELRSVPDAARAGAEEAFASVALVDLGSTEAGLEAASGLTLPCVVVGETGGGDGERVYVLVRPFSLGELSDAIMRAAEAARVADEARAALAEIAHDTFVEPEPVVAEQPEPEPVAVPAPVVLLEERVVEEPEPIVLEPVVEPLAVAAQELIAFSDLEPQPEMVAETVVVDAPAEEIAPEPVAVAPEPVAAEPEPVAVAPEPVAAEPEPVAVGPEPATAVDLLAELDEPAAASASLLADLDEPAPPPPPQPKIVRRQPRKPLRQMREILPRRRIAVNARKEPEPEPAIAAARPAHQSDPLTRRLGAAVSACKDLDSLLADVPLLAQPRAVAHAFLNEVVELFGPQTAAVYIRRPEGSWGVLAPHGLSKIEADIRVSPDHALFREVSSGLQGIYIAPVDLAGGLVAGIGGARTETLMVAPLVAGGACCGIVVAGGPAFTEIDLEHLCDIANDAAAGLAFAQTVEKLRGRI